MAQGVFVASNLSARTYIGSLEGALAGTNVAGQMLAGASPDALQPVGPVDHHQSGEFFSGLLGVPGVPPYQSGYVQLVAWDSALWGNSLAAVPPDQLGRTDVVTVFLTTGVFPDSARAPRFVESAIVPVPEPTTWLAILGFSILWFRGRV